MSEPLKEVTALMIQLSFFWSLVLSGHELERHPFFVCAYLTALVVVLMVATYRESKKLRFRSDGRLK